MRMIFQSSKLLVEYAKKQAKKHRVYVVKCPPSLCPKITSRAQEFNKNLERLCGDQVNYKATSII